MTSQLRPLSSWSKLFGAAVLLMALSACTNGRDLDRPAVPLGDFKLGHSVVIAPNLTMGPLSREATDEEWIAELDAAIEDRFRRYDGERIYHFGVSIEGYVLAQVGIPLVLQPQSALIFRITVWDDEAGVKMNLEPQEITVLEAVSTETMVGSGITQTREEQLEALAILGAKQIEQWLVQQKRDASWFRGFRPEGSRPEALESVAVSEAAGQRTEGRVAPSVDALDQEDLEEIVDDANSGPVDPDRIVVEGPLEETSDP